MRFECCNSSHERSMSVPRRLALLDQHDRRVHVGGKRQRVRAGQNRRHVEHDETVAIAAAKLANHVGHHRRAHQFRGIRDGRTAGKHDEVADVGMDQEIFEGRVAHQIVRKAGPRLQLQHVAQVGIAQVGVDQEGRVVNLHGEAHCEVEGDRGLASALVGARHGESLPRVLSHLHQHLRSQEPKCVGRRVIAHRDHAMAFEHAGRDLDTPSARVGDVPWRAPRERGCRS